MTPRQAIQPSAPAGRALWLKWVLANAIGAAITFLPAFIAPRVSEALGATAVSLLALLSGVLIALTAGMLQWLVLRRYVRWANQWGLVTSIGWFVGGFLASYAAFAVLGARPSTLSFYAVTAPVNAAVVGTFQWLILRRHVHRAGWWVLASIAAWAIGERLGFYAGFYVALYAGAAVSGLGQDVSAMVFSASFAAVAGALAGSMTGIVLVWLLRHPHLDAPAIS